MEIGDLASLGLGEEEGGGVGRVSSALITTTTEGDSERAFFFDFIERSCGLVLRFSGSISLSESAREKTKRKTRKEI